jgi:hypothetical protein
VSPLASKLFEVIERDLVGRPSFILRPTTVAAVLRINWHLASDIIDELARAGHIVAVARNVRLNIIWQLSAHPQPCSDPPRERFVGRGMTSRRDKCETVLAFLRAQYAIGETFSIGHQRLKTTLCVSVQTVGDALKDLIANDVLAVVAQPRNPRGRNRPATYVLTGRELPAEIEIARRTSLKPRSMYAVGSPSNKIAGSAPRAEME